MFDWNSQRPTKETFMECEFDRDRIQWLFDRLMFLEEQLYSAKNFTKFQQGVAARPNGWKNKKESNGNE